MDLGGIVLSCVLLAQMALILLLLNPVYDIRIVVQYLNYTIHCHKNSYLTIVGFYFIGVVYLGMYIPLQNVHKLIFGQFQNDYEKLLVLKKVEKNYLIAGFSLFLVVVLYGLRALISYSVCLLEQAERRPGQVSLKPMTAITSRSFDQKPTPQMSSFNILPSLLRLKRSISYETLLFANELKVLRNIIQNSDPKNCVTRPEKANVAEEKK